jgi:hypothetical protein
MKKRFLDLQPLVEEIQKLQSFNREKEEEFSVTRSNLENLASTMMDLNEIVKIISLMSS